jgi:hypothetical protein
MSPTQLNVYIGVMSAIGSFLLTYTILSYRYEKNIFWAKKLAFESGAYISGETLRLKEGRAYKYGFEEGVAFEEKQDQLEEMADKLEEEREMLREEIANWNADPDMTLHIYPFAGRNY